MDRDLEIARINHELEILRARYALYERWGRVLRMFFMVGLPLAIVLLSAKLFSVDALMGAFVIGMTIVLATLLWLAGNGRIRWIDVASVRASPFSMSAAVPFSARRGASDARLIEDQIDEREQRLTELGARP